MAFRPVDEVDVSSAASRVYEHGWQSWSPAATYEAGATSVRPSAPWHQLMRFRPETPPPAEGFQAEGLLVVDPGTGAPARVYAAAGPVEVPSIRAERDGNRLLVSADGPVTTSLSGERLESGLAAFAEGFASRCGTGPPRAAPTVWCSWYHYFLDVTEDDIGENLVAIGKHDLPVEVVQIDDGWQAGVGDWLQLSGRFSSLPRLAGRIRDGGRRAGIWVAPFVVGADSVLAQRNPGWLVGAAGANWGQRLHGLDLSHPGARAHLSEVFTGLRDAGFDYFKLDFLYAGALTGHRHADVGALAAYRSGLELIRDAVGPDAYMVGCGAPILPSVGLVDAMRVSPDVYNPSHLDDGAPALRAEMCTVARAWQHGRFWVNDSDCLLARPAFARRREWARIVERYGGLRSSSDRIADLDEWGLDTTRRLLTDVPPPVPFSP